MQNILNNFIDDMKNNIPGFIAVSVTEVESGVAYESFSTKDDFDPNLASAYNLEVVKAKLKAIEALGLQENIRDITVTLSDQIHIINIAPSGAYFIYLAIDSADTNLGIVRSLLDKYKASLNEAL